MTATLGLTAVSLAGCVGLHFARRDSAAETVCAVIALAPFFILLVAFAA